MRQLVVGCDLSRAFLDLCDLPSDRLQRLPNTRDAIANWAETLTSELSPSSKPPAAATTPSSPP